MSWQFVLTDLFGVVHGDVLNTVGDRKVQFPHMRIPTASFAIPLTNPYATTVMDTDCLLKCYRNDPTTGARTLAFHGPIISAEEVGDETTQSISVNAAGPMWRLTRRIIPRSKTLVPGTYGTLSTPVDLGGIAQLILTEVNEYDFTGIQSGTNTASINGWAGPWWLKNAAEAIAQLHAGLNSFEYEVAPVEPSAYGIHNPSGWPKIGEMNVAPTIGVSRPDAIFEYGTGRGNIGSYKRSVDRADILTEALVSVEGWPDAVAKDVNGNPLYGLVDAWDAPARAARGFFEEVVPEGGVLDNNLRNAIGQFHLALRKQPREIITFSPSLNARPSPFVDYKVGDTVRARAYANGVARFDALFRIWGLNFTIDQNGNETAELELVKP